MHRVSTRSWVLRFSAVLVAASVAGSFVGCSKKKEDAKAVAEKAKADRDKVQQGDRYADGKRLEATLKDWAKRWDETAELPACDPLLKDAAELELCKTAAAALVTMKAAAKKPEPNATLIHLAAELSFATEAASEKLRNASMEKLQAERAKNAPAPSGSAAAGKPPAKKVYSSDETKARALGSAAKLGERVKELEAAPADPGMQVMQAYSRANRAAFRYLSQFLQFGPLPTRRSTLDELEGLSKRKESWPALGRTLREAALVENDPELQGRLKTLSPKLTRRGAGMAPATPAIASSLPPGHTPPPSTVIKP
jgi:hypothetical protein